MSDSFATDVLKLAVVELRSGAADPSAGAGVVASIGSLYLRSVTAELWQKTTAPDTGWVLFGGGGAGGPVGQIIEVIEASAPSGVLGNGVTYTPLVQAAADTIEFQFVAAATGNIEIALVYVMSAANAGLVELRLDRLINSDGSSPAAALSAGTPFTFTPGNDVNQHSVASSDSSELQLAVTAGDMVRGLIQRPTGGGDTHTGDFRIIQLLVRAV